MKSLIVFVSAAFLSGSVAAAITGLVDSATQQFVPDADLRYSPLSHALRHTLGGDDELLLDASQIGSGEFPDARVADNITAGQFAADPSPCPGGDFVTDIAADGTLTCATPPTGGSGPTVDGNVVTDIAAGAGATFTSDGDGSVTLNISTGTATLADGNYTDVTVSGNGTVITLNPGVVDVANLASADFGDFTCNGSVCTLDASYLTTETDPVYSADPAAGITAQDVLDWNAAFSWGDHSAAGYLTSYNETDPLFSAENTLTELETRISADLATVGELPTDTNAATLCTGANVYLDGEGNCNTISGGTDDQTAAEVAVTPVGNLNSTNVQAALEEHQADINALAAGSADGVTTGGALDVPNEELDVTVAAPGSSFAVDLSSIGGLTSFSGWDKNAADDFDGDWSSLTGTPTTLAGYGITDAATSAQGMLADSAVQTETDPVYSAAPAATITAQDLLNYDAAFGWGDHAVAGYLTSYTETDPVFAAEDTLAELEVRIGTTLLESADIAAGAITPAAGNLDLTGTNGQLLVIDAVGNIVPATVEDAAYTRILNPTAGTIQSWWRNPTSWTAAVVEIWCESDQTVNLDVQVDDGTPADIIGSDITCAPGGVSQTVLGGDTLIETDETLDVEITSVTAAPTWVSLQVRVEYQ